MRFRFVRRLGFGKLGFDVDVGNSPREMRGGNINLCLLYDMLSAFFLHVTIVHYRGIILNCACSKIQAIPLRVVVEAPM